MVTIHAVEQPKDADISPLSSGDEKREWHIVAVKGAPDVVLDLCTHLQTMKNVDEKLTDERRKAVLAANDAMTDSALRVLGVAYRMAPVLPEEINSESWKRI